MKASRLRAIPAVEKVLHSLGDVGLPRPLVVDVVRHELKALRAEKAVPATEAVVERVRAALDRLRASRIQPIVNGTGIIVHTNFGRAPLGDDVVAALASIGANYNNLEYSLMEGGRGDRAAYLERAVAVLCGAEAATVVNNNAAALLLIVRHFCGGAASDVVVSRGELIQIGGGFRIPDLLESSGARLREIGTTNQTSLTDYARAIGRRTGLVLKVHRSNFFMEGFVASPAPPDIAVLARKKRVPFVEDLGSGAIIATESLDGLEHEPTPAETLRRGADLVCFSGDKLLGGPQAGIIAGRRTFVAALKRQPLFRALRCDKLILAGLETAVDQYLRGGRGVPVVQMLDETNDALRSRAAQIVSALAGLRLTARIGEGRAQIGGGTLPRSVMPSVAIDVVHQRLPPQELARRLRRSAVPVVGYVAHGRLKIDLRTVFPRQDADVVNALRAA
jgi:L-seryl-tRNA(Ser) seleniumtransferase